MSRSIRNPALTAAITGSLALAGQAFAATPLAQGYMLAADTQAAAQKPVKAAEGKCGEGRCGAMKADAKKPAAAKPVTPAPKAAEGKCGEGRCGAMTPDTRKPAKADAKRDGA